MPSEHSTCAFCDDFEGEDSDVIVFCDGCNLVVHQDCYDVPYIPEGQLLCRKCTVSPENPVTCILCHNEGGAFKQIVNSEWVHLLCAIWVPETRVANKVFMESAIGVDKISKHRWKLKEQQEARKAALAAEADEDDEDKRKRSSIGSKCAHAFAKTYKCGPPLHPAIVSLKREARTGAPLLKRFHLEPWTAAAAAAGKGKLKSEEERWLKFGQLRQVEQYLEKLRELSALIWKRESRKLQQMEIIQVRNSLSVVVLRLFSRYFLICRENSVHKVDVPDYFAVITQPMCWLMIDAKLDRHEYWDMKDCRNDIELVLVNATTYNKAGSPFYEITQKILNSAMPIL
ncbi:hypothetical protein F5877DRAFT_84004 [Lentinula edodes]|nr:hypothetical protein F5877DRAFT_84004 [Lentinula edodes]